MVVKIDNYIVSTNDWKDYKVCLDGQAIIHSTYPDGHTHCRGVLVLVALQAIDRYNARHNCSWGENK